MWIHKFRKVFQTSAFLNDFFTAKYKKSPALCYKAGLYEVCMTIRIQHYAEYAGME